MLKQVGKSAAWGALYVSASTFGTTVAMIFIILNNLAMFNVESDVFMDVWMEKILQAFVPGSFIAGLICIAAYWIYYRCVRKYPSELKRVELSKALFMLSIGLAFNLIVSYALEFIWSFLPEALTSQTSESTDFLVDSNYHWLFKLLAVGIIAPIAEEIVFRHGFCRTLAKGNVSMGIILSSFVFGAAHGNLIQGIYTFIMGLICAIVIQNTDNIWYPIMIHVGLNSSTVIASCVPEAFNDITLIGLGFIGVLVVATQLIHNEGMRAMLKKPNMVAPLQVMTPMERLQEKTMVENPGSYDNAEIPGEIVEAIDSPIQT